MRAQRGWTGDALRSWTRSMSTILPRKLHEQNHRRVQHGDCSSERNQRSFSWHSLATLWHFSIIDMPSLLHPQQHQWLFFPSYRSLYNKGICWFSKGQVALFSTSPLSPPPSLPGVPTGSCPQFLAVQETQPRWHLWHHQHSQRRAQSGREHVPPPKGAPFSTSR